LFGGILKTMHKILTLECSGK